MSTGLSRTDKLDIYIKRVHELFPEIDVSSAWSMYAGEYPTSGKIDLSGTSAV